MTDWGELAASQLAAVAEASETGQGVTRLPFTSEHRQALNLLSDWMRDAGLEVSIDHAGTLVGRLDGPADSPTFLLGSHQDSVREGGGFDGIMGIVLPILTVRRLREEGVELPFAVEVLAFADEEGVRFPTALVGSRALAGTFDPTVLEVADRDGVTLRVGMEEFGLQPGGIPGLRRAAGSVKGYLEVHIEQGPVLEGAGEALGVVSAISGIERHQLIVTGEAGHAGTLPMEARRDALAGAAAIVTEVERMAKSTPELRGTVGELVVSPNMANAVAREVRMIVELRSPEDKVREQSGAEIQAFARRTAKERGLVCEVASSYRQSATPCDQELTEILASAVRAGGGKGLELPSGATHDASAMADLCPITMLFVRCRDGVSHHPDEFASSDDMAMAIDALCGFLKGVT